MTNREQPGVVVVGTGFGLFTHVRALREAGFEVRAIVGRNLQTTQERAAPLGIKLATDNLAEALADPASILVSVATPPHAHYPVVMEAIAAGRHVMCEKPFAKDLDEARQMLAAAKAAGVVHMLGTEFRFDAAQALLRRIVKQGRIGEPKHFLRVHYQAAFQDPSEKLADWWVDAAQGGGYLGAFGIHMIDQAQYNVGRISRVSGQLQTLAPGRQQMTADDTFNIQFVTDQGVRGLIMAAMAVPGPMMVTTRIVGSAGSAWIESGTTYGEAEQVWIADSEGARVVSYPDDLVYPTPTPFPIAGMMRNGMDQWHAMGVDIAPYARLFGELRARIEGRAVEGPELGATFADAVQDQAVFDAVKQSSACGEWVAVAVS